MQYKWCYFFSLSVAVRQEVLFRQWQMEGWSFFVNSGFRSPSWSQLEDPTPTDSGTDTEGPESTVGTLLEPGEQKTQGQVLPFTRGLGSRVDSGDSTLGEVWTGTLGQGGDLFPETRRLVLTPRTTSQDRVRRSSVTKLPHGWERGNPVSLRPRTESGVYTWGSPSSQGRSETKRSTCPHPPTLKVRGSLV